MGSDIGVFPCQTLGISSEKAGCYPQEVDAGANSRELAWLAARANG
jgi:hypothetical protein